MRVRNPIHAFNGGEISRRMEGRSDLDGIYDRAVAKMVNFVPAVEGPAMKRPGFRYVREAHITSSRLTRFVFNVTQAYVLEWLDGAIRFYTNGGRIETSPGVAYEVAVPYTAADAAKISIKQSYDRLYLSHPNYPPAMLTRTGAETFTYAKIPLANGPFKDWNTDKTRTITWLGDPEVDGYADIVASSDLFSPEEVGSGFIFEVKDFSTVKAWEPQVRTQVSDSSSVKVGDLRRSGGRVYRCASLGGNEYTGNIEPTHTEGLEWDGSGDVIAGTTNDNAGVQWEYVHDRFGAGTIEQVISPTQARIKVTRRLPEIAATVPTHKWAQAAFSDAAGYPQLVDVWAQRLMFWKDVDLAASVTGDYFDFSPIDKNGSYAPDMGFRRRLDVSDPPMWSHADKEYMIAGTASGELVVGQINRAAGLSSDNIRADLQSSYGSAGAWPLAIGTSLLFVQRGGRKIREAVFDGRAERFAAANINVYARHITRSGVSWLAFQQEPEQLLWAGRADGTLIAHPHSPEQQTKGFARIELSAGTVLSGVTIPSEDGSRDELWILAELAGQKAVLQLADWWDEDAGLPLSDAYFVDWGVSYDGEPMQTFSSGLSHLEGRNVRILADGIVIDNLTVTDGTIELPKPASKVHIGLGYQARLKLLRPEMRGAPTMQGLRKRLLRMFARLIDTASLLTVNRHGDQDRFFDRQNALAMNGPAGLFNGDTDNVAAGAGSDFEETGELVNDDPLPATLSMLVATYELEELK